MKVGQLTNGVYPVRIGRPGDEDVVWGEWRKRELHVQRFVGKVRIVALADGSWAEYTPEQFDPHSGVFEAEGRYMQVEGVTEP